MYSVSKLKSMKNMCRKAIKEYRFPLQNPEKEEKPLLNGEFPMKRYALEHLCKDWAKP